jgi:hypothetical protein
VRLKEPTQKRVDEVEAVKVEAASLERPAMIDRPVAKKEVDQKRRRRANWLNVPKQGKPR